MHLSMAQLRHEAKIRSGSVRVTHDRDGDGDVTLGKMTSSATFAISSLIHVRLAFILIFRHQRTKRSVCGHPHLFAPQQQQHSSLCAYLQGGIRAPRSR